MRGRAEPLAGALWSAAAVALAAGGVAFDCADTAERAAARAVVGLLSCVAAAALARRGQSLLGPVLAFAGLMLIVAGRAPEPPLLPIPAIDRPGPRQLARAQRVVVTGAPELARRGWRLPVRWLASCAPDLRDCVSREFDLGLWLPPGEPPRPGAVLRLGVPVHPLAVPANPGFSGLQAALRRRGEAGALRVRSYTQVAVERPGQTTIGYRLATLRGWLRRRLDRGLAPDHAAIVRGLALGDRSGVDDDLRAALQASGTAHVLAVSGAHVGIVAAIALWALRWLLLRAPAATFRLAPLAVWQLPLALAVVLAYVALAGAPQSARRAAVMAAAVLFLRAVSLRSDAPETLGWAFVLALLVDPDAVADVGLQLSCLGVLGALWGARRTRGTAPPWQWLGVSLAAWATTAVVAVPTFGALPWTAPLANLLVVPLFGLVLLPLSLLALVLAVLPAAVAEVGLAGLDLVLGLAVVPLQWLAAAPDWLLPQLFVPASSRSWLGAVPVLLLAAWWLEGEVVRRGAGAAAVVCAAVGAWVWPGPPPEGEVDVVFLDVGHGDATLLRFADGATMLVDAGGEVGDDGRVGARAVVPALRALGIARIDVMVVSHPHPDHENGLLAVARAMPVGSFWSNGQPGGGREHKALAALLRSRGVPRQVFDRDAPRRFRWAGAQVEVLWPRAPTLPFDPALSANDNSLVLRVRTAGASLLLAGDVEAPAEARLIATGQDLYADVLKVPHHGSKTSSTVGFLRRVAPRLAVAGARPWGPLPFPDQIIDARYAAHGIPLRTTSAGAVHLRLGRDGWTARQASAFWSGSRSSRSAANAAKKVSSESVRPSIQPGGT
ncbi:MAG: DNA internalization-related competence protein ComEC/Rec2 [Deltaproteobacteria bacterium]|nr:DNA internalization-related competence protein ComEC/Rec2 [Deltaproteobacteria bacterium]